jgi:hypothetical protein
LHRSLLNDHDYNSADEEDENPTRRSYFNLCGDMVRVFGSEEEKDDEMIPENDTDSFYTRMINEEPEDYELPLPRGLDTNDDSHMEIDSTIVNQEISSPSYAQRLCSCNDKIEDGGKELKKKMDEDELAEVETCASSQIDPDECKLSILTALTLIL